MDSFAPGQKASQTQLEAVGLGYLFPLLNSGMTIGDAKVDGSTGVMFTPNLGGKPADVTAYQPATQTWITHGKIKIGWETAAPPTAEVLARYPQVIGYQLTASGTVWTIPLARSPRGISNIPQDFVWNESGDPVACRRADFDWLWDLSGEVWDYWHTDKGNELGESWLAKAALRILQVNYFIGPAELNAFRSMGRPVMDQMSVAAISLALIDNDFPKLVDDAKKNEAT